MIFFYNAKRKLDTFCKRPLTLRGGLLFLCLYVLLVVVRIPSILIDGRFWCEEGPIFFHNALVLPSKEAIFSSYGGYLNLATTLTTFIAAKCFPLVYAPYFTTFIGLTFQCFPALLILTAQESWLKTAKDKAICLLTLLLVPLASECWMQSLHLQIWLDLCCAIILCLTPSSYVISFFRYFCLGMASLSGLGCVAFIPVFFLRFLTDQKKTYLLSGLILLLGALIEMVFFYHPFFARASIDKVFFWPFIFLSREVFLPLLGNNFVTIGFSSFIGFIWHHTSYKHTYDAIGVFLYLTFVYVSVVFIFGRILWYSFWDKKYRILFWLLLANICFLILVLSGAMGDLQTQLLFWSNERYYCASQALVGLSFAIFYILSKKKWALGCLLCLWGIGVAHYFSPVLQNKEESQAWEKEVASWQLDHSYRPKTWTDFPENDWRINLNGQDYKFWPCYMLENPAGCQK